MACVCTSNTLEGDHFAMEGPDACFSVALDPMSCYPHKCCFCLLDGPKISHCWYTPSCCWLDHCYCSDQLLSDQRFMFTHIYPSLDIIDKVNEWILNVTQYVVCWREVCLDSAWTHGHEAVPKYCFVYDDKALHVFCKPTSPLDCHDNPPDYHRW